MIRGLWLLAALIGVVFAANWPHAQTYIGVPLNMGTTQVSVATTPTLVEANRQRASVTLENLGTNQVCFGQTSAVSLSNGICLPGTVGAAVTIPYIGPIWGIATTSATTIAVMDLY
jgi:hypothetical protein